MVAHVRSLILLLVLLASPAVGEESTSPGSGGLVTSRSAVPPTRREETVDTYHGVEVRDPYRWLEDLGSPATERWARMQDGYTAGRLDSTEAYARFSRFLARLTDMDRYSGAAIRRGERLFVARTEGVGVNGLTHLVRQGDGELETLVASRRLFGDGPRRLSSSRAVSGDGELFAYGHARTGSLWIRMRLLRVADRALLEELEGLYSSYSSFGWTADERSPEGWGFYYVRFPMPAAGEEMNAKPQGGRVFYHRVGTPQDRDAVFFDPEDEKSSLSVQVTDDGRYLLLRSGRAGETATSYLVRDLLAEDGKLRRIAAVDGGTLSFVGNHGARFFFHTDDGAPRGRLVAAELGREGFAEVIAEPERAVVQRVDLVADRFLVLSQDVAIPKVEVFGLDGRLERQVELPVLGMPWSGFSGRRQDARAYFGLSSAVDPGSVYRLDPRTGDVEIELRSDTPVDPQDFLIRQVSYKSDDGTVVPMFLVHKKDLDLEKPRPTFLYGYGAYGWVAFPWFQPHVVAWLDAGGIYAMPGIRGGGEHGDAWYEAGRRRNKVRAIADYVAAAEWLVKKGITTREILVANGGSASGVVAAAAIVSRPDLFAAAVIDIPSLDMLRHETSPRGGYWVAEFGTVEDAEDFKALYAYSPYHRIEAGRCYPPTIVTVGERDEITPPWNGYKFTARMQERQAKGCENDTLLQVVWGEGHGFGTTPEQSVRTWARQLAFLAPVLGGSRPSHPRPHLHRLRQEPQVERRHQEEEGRRRPTP